MQLENAGFEGDSGIGRVLSSSAGGRRTILSRSPVHEHGPALLPRVTQIPSRCGLNEDRAGWYLQPMDRELSRKALLTYARIFARWGAEEAVRSHENGGAWKGLLEGQASIEEQLGAFRRTSQDQTKDLQRFKDGYDWKILRGISTSLIQLVDLVRRRLVVLSESEHPTGDLEIVRDEVLDLLEAHGIYEWSPDVGSTYVELLDRLEVVGAECTTDQRLVGTVAQVHRTGFLRERPDGSTTSAHNARVTVYRAKEEEEGSGERGG